MVAFFQLDLIAGLAEKLQAVPEGNGTMLDNTLIVFLSDSGQQHHANYENFPMVLMGNCGGNLRMGQHLQYPGHGKKDNHTIGNMYTTILHAAGFPRDGFGQFDVATPADMQKRPLSELLL